jgi:hypothetical protein
VVEQRAGADGEQQWQEQREFQHGCDTSEWHREILCEHEKSNPA